MEAFQLRLWDGRLGRWLSPDPYGQYASPYLGMGNNPLSLIDPDGGKTDDFYKNNTTGAIEWFDGSGAIDGYEHLGVSFSFTDAFNNVTAWGESRFGSIVSWDQKDGFFHHNYTLDEVVISRSPKSDFYYLDIYRDTETSRSTTSTFSFRDIDGYFLEPAGADTRRSGMDRRIPEGDYNLTSHSSKKYPNHFKLYNDEVSQSRAILIHPGNSPAHTLGCLLPGSSRSTDFVGGSKSKYLQLKNAINEVGVKNVVVRIHNNINNVP